MHMSIVVPPSSWSDPARLGICSRSSARAPERRSRGTRASGARATPEQRPSSARVAPERHAQRARDRKDVEGGRILNPTQVSSLMHDAPLTLASGK